MIMNFGEFLNANKKDQIEVFKKIKSSKPDEWFVTYIPRKMEYKDECPYAVARIYSWYEEITTWDGRTIRGDEVEALMETDKTTLLLIPNLGGIEGEIVIKHKRASEYSCFSYDGILQPVFEYYGYGNKEQVLGKKYQWFFERLTNK
jgi:hypothetical protein